jgi:hypothetical protein
MHHEGIGEEAENELGQEDCPMPTMKAKIQGVDLAEGKEKHEENEPRKARLQRQEVWVAYGSDEHAQPQGVGVKKFAHYLYFRKLGF